MMRRPVQTPAIVTISPGYFTNDTRGHNQGYTSNNSQPTISYTLEPNVAYIHATQPHQATATPGNNDADNSPPPPAYSSIVKN